MTQYLPEHLKVALATLRTDPHFQEIMRLISRRPLAPRIKPMRPPFATREKVLDEMLYASGQLAGERSIMIEVLGYDPNDRQSE